MSCLFISLGKLLQVDPTFLRNQIIDYIVTNPSKEWDGTKISDWISMVAGDRYQNIEQYTSMMRNNSQWGGAPEIAICCLIYNVNVEIVNLRNRNLPNVIFSNQQSKSQQTPQQPQSDDPPQSETWDDYINKLYHDYLGLIKMKRFRQGHPLRKNYESFMQMKREDFNKKQSIDISKYMSIQKCNILPHGSRPNIEKPRKTLIISWTGNHYEPVEIKNHHQS